MMNKLKILNKCFNIDNINKGKSVLLFFNTENSKKEQIMLPFYTAALYVKSEISIMLCKKYKYSKFGKNSLNTKLP